MEASNTGPIDVEDDVEVGHMDSACSQILHQFSRQSRFRNVAKRWALILVLRFFVALNMYSIKLCKELFIYSLEEVVSKILIDFV